MLAMFILRMSIPLYKLLLTCTEYFTVNTITMHSKCYLQLLKGQVIGLQYIYYQVCYGSDRSYK